MSATSSQIMRGVLPLSFTEEDTAQPNQNNVNINI
jgi:hypothetical protein